MDHAIDDSLTQEEDACAVTQWGQNQLMKGFSSGWYASSYKQMQKKKRLKSVHHIHGEDVFFPHAKY
jgi:hypothetical protein